MELEKWKNIKEYPGYQVSNLGRIRTFNKISFTKRHGERHWENRILKFKPNKPTKKTKQGTGYRVSLWKNGKSKDFLVARLVACTFLNYPLDTKLTVNHLDGNRTNNNIKNLELISRKENISYGFDNHQYDNTMFSTTLYSKNKYYKFRSVTKACEFLGRCSGYLQTREKLKKDTAISITGIEYFFYIDR